MELYIGLIGVILGGFIAFGNNWLSERRNRKKHGEYLAIRIVCVLDKFIEGCLAVMRDSGQEDSEGYSRATANTPSLDLNIPDIDWKSIPSSLMYEALMLPSYIEESDRIIDSVVEYVASPPDYSEVFEARQFQYARLGVRAYSLAEKLRKKYKIDLREELEDLDYLEFMKTHISKHETTLIERQQRHNEMQQMIGEASKP